MAEANSNRLMIRIFGDHEVITPVNKLDKYVVKFVAPGDDPLTRAEAALAALSSEFSDWMTAECDRLDSARDAVKQHGFNERTFDELFHSAHDIKGDAATFGFPLAAAAAESLCRVLEHSPDTNRVPLELIDQHVDAVRAIVRETARPDIAEIATALTSKLRQVSDDFLIHENRHRPDYLEGLMAPPLVPGQ
ncbi:Hpt domain-containing protein [Pseudorhodoplanes sp.]|uniref:Hpt domain-containing protein n=1 Tax=Pseudorhodoplanes sp. TaxID=1934341 RepID=UPI002BCE215A|nr:Hpt domain-containing protein [Pseudorhodoplanes sp.]HWV54480.1 Hpt domain-containing protein [Pseudorhodoplanes sp.]